MQVCKKTKGAEYFFAPFLCVVVAYAEYYQTNTLQIPNSNAYIFTSFILYEYIIKEDSLFDEIFF